MFRIGCCRGRFHIFLSLTVIWGALHIFPCCRCCKAAACPALRIRYSYTMYTCTVHRDGDRITPMSREKLQNNLGNEFGPTGSRRGLHMVFGARGGGWAGVGGGGRGWAGGEGGGGGGRVVGG